MEKIFETTENLAATIARFALGVVILPHGLQKLLGIWGGSGFSTTLENFQATSLPFLVAFTVIIAESFGAFFLVLGFLSRLSALFITAGMIGAIIKVHSQFGFFMNWNGLKPGEGFEYHLLAIALGAIVIIYGGGKWAVDSLLYKRIQHNNQQEN